MGGMGLNSPILSYRVVRRPARPVILLLPMNNKPALQCKPSHPNMAGGATSLLKIESTPMITLSI